eukprot:TRINITY_DN11940_c0_g3_i1.p1 TRINITY_DN11940_c0_g3~~TRINITY_DN11940_c0_g3_i1.p1  ORF type:complete len:1330 (+),score=353.10 TRINITY_DN11940_c0_g3_i1:119-3991(+)
MANADQRKSVTLVDDHSGAAGRQSQGSAVTREWSRGSRTSTAAQEHPQRRTTVRLQLPGEAAPDKAQGEPPSNGAGEDDPLNNVNVLDSSTMPQAHGPLWRRRASAVARKSISAGRQSLAALAHGVPIAVVKLTPDEEHAFREFFGQLDSGMDGTIPVGDLVHACHLLQIQLSRQAVEERFRVIDTGDGRVDVDEFLAFLAWAKSVGAFSFSPERLEWVLHKLVSERQREIRGTDLYHTQLPGGFSCVHELREWVFEAVLFLSSLYYGFAVPLHIALHEHRDLDSWWYTEHLQILVVEMILTAAALVDLLRLQSPPGAEAAALAAVAASRKSNWKRYASSARFLVNLAAGLPVDLIGYAVGSHELHYAGYVLRLSGLAKIPSLFHLGQTRLVSAGAARWSFELAPRLRLAAYIVLCLHICACAFILATPGDDENHNNSADRYLVAMYWTVYTISSVGYGDVDVPSRGAKVLAIGMFMVSIALNGVFVGKITSFMMVDSSGEHRETMAKTRQILSQFAIPQEMREDILSLQNHLLEMKLTLQSFRDVVGRMPTIVQENLGLYARVQQLRQVPLFHYVSARCQVALAESLRTRVACRDEYITCEGDSADALYFITHGVVEVLQGDSRVALALRGGFFGEVPLANEQAVSSATTRTLTYSELLVLGKSDFDEIAAHFPALKQHTRRAIERQRRGQGPGGEEITESQETITSGEIETDITAAIQETLQKRLFSFRASTVHEIDYSDLGQDTAAGPPVRFYGFTGEWGHLCSFWPSPFEVGGAVWPTLEHFFQAMKFAGTPHADDVRAAQTPELARQIGKDRSRPLRADWDRVREDVMFCGLRAKFSQSATCRAVLLSTGQRRLVFSDSSDDYWGIGPAGDGQNVLGTMLTVVREEIQQATVRFCGPSGEYGPLANSFPCPVVVDDTTWPSVEHYYQGMKWQGTPREEEIRAAPSPEAAYRIGSESRPGEALRGDWEEVREGCMHRGLQVKFAQSEAARAVLLGTAPGRIINADPQDPIWGEGPEGAGRNLLGALLVLIRDQLAYGAQCALSESEATPRSEVAGAYSPLPSPPQQPQPPPGEYSMSSAVSGAEQKLNLRISQHTSNVPSDSLLGKDSAQPSSCAPNLTSPREREQCAQAGAASTAGPFYSAEQLDLCLQMRETQLQQQEFLSGAVRQLVANQNAMQRRLREIADPAVSSGFRHDAHSTAQHQFTVASMQPFSPLGPLSPDGTRSPGACATEEYEASALPSAVQRKRTPDREQLDFSVLGGLHSSRDERTTSFLPNASLRNNRRPF